LGIPALLAGAITANQNADTLKNLTQQQAQLSKALSQEAQIPILPQTPVSPIKGQTSLQLEYDHFFLSLWEVHTAYAQVSTDLSALPGSQLSQLGIQIQQRPYLVVIDSANTEQEALAKAAALRPQLPQVDVVRAGRDFLVVQGGGPRTQPEALLEAIRLRNDYHLNPSVLPSGPK
jgi:hypothetical protein